ncbi:diacylglycerol/lipid kinase family protein [Longimicrobium sp.]|uniref:diacylglycerol/lipid kinase family protein n=1 Tax=Longimicrobium sp. TaxID=2029185 RepID=UPI002E368CB4|nr:diacylglycerol kinase family protein [Longimicrobium sp.]HEX6036823.1 diacylglycerol kinase family protein [Longimicrobium sp.]
MRRALLIYNPAAGQWWRRPRPEHLRDTLARHGWDVTVLTTEGQDHATELVRAHLSPEIEAVWTSGGDGTLSQAATALVDSGVPIGIIPVGTVNVIAREIGLPSGAPKAIAAIANSKARRSFRAWRASGRGVLLGIGAGFDARAMGRVSMGAKHALGLLAIGARGVWEWARYDFPALHVTGEDDHGRPIDTEATQVLATIPRHFAGSHVLVPDADPADPWIDVVLFDGRSHARLAAFWLGVEAPGTLQLRVPGVRVLRARRLSIVARDGRAEPTHVNGDVVDATPFHLEPWGTVTLLAPER